MAMGDHYSVLRERPSDLADQAIRGESTLQRDAATTVMVVAGRSPVLPAPRHRSDLYGDERPGFHVVRPLRIP
jgi:hypothetical protein